MLQGAHELGGVRLPYAGTHAVFMYSTAADGNVTLQLRDSDDLDRSGLASMLARLQDDATLSISYQDSDILSDGSIDVLLGATSGPLHASGKFICFYIEPTRGHLNLLQSVNDRTKGAA